YKHLPTPTEQQLKGKYISPADLRGSPGFDELLRTAVDVRKKDPEKAHFSLSTAQLKADEVAHRLAHFDHLCGRAATRLKVNAFVNEQYFDIQELAETKDESPEQALAEAQLKLRRQPDPLHVVGLDRVPESAWFSVGELRVCRRHPEKWRDFIEERLGEMPQRYISPDCMQALREFQDHVKAGNGQKDVDDLRALLEKRRNQKVKEFEQAQKKADKDAMEQLLDEIVRANKDNEKRLADARDKAQGKSEKVFYQAIVAEIRDILKDSDDRVLRQLQQGLDLAKTKHYHPDDPAFRMMHLGYLESLFPDVYRKSLDAQPFPRKLALRVLDSLEQTQEAYKSGDAGQFEQASEAFFRTLRDTSDETLVNGLAERNPSPAVKNAFADVEKTRKSHDNTRIEQANDSFFQTAGQEGVRVNPYPGLKTIGLELLFNRVQPFLWGWVIMLAGVLSLIASMVLRSRYCYLLGFAFYFVSLAVQAFGFFTRIYISGRAPVSNMYETVIWVAFMSAIFALVLELVYRRKVILLAGALMSFFGLVLADQMPLALDPKISPLVPVLRSNYWLTVHVLTIVSSYAAGTLAWALGNITLVLLTFGKGRRDTLKMLSQFTYRAVQIAVLLLAAGTFLGGWWAAESLGRFWGWDSKEVGALVALVCYVIPLHARFIGWVMDFGLAVCAVVCYAFILFSWYVVNFVIAAGLHSYGFGGGGGTWVAWAALLNIEWVLIASMIYRRRLRPPDQEPPAPVEEFAAV
ncbi:MAG TPA: cytochrome c biogenesis protein CcsA, partial [Gemmataceae bacterium]|nr:cytochrome c biogenesis protein CcsA [Gemmataceae bacterium]